MSKINEAATKWANERCPAQDDSDIVWCMCKEDFLEGAKVATIPILADPEDKSTWPPFMTKILMAVDYSRNEKDEIHYQWVETQVADTGEEALKIYFKSYPKYWLPLPVIRKEEERKHYLENIQMKMYEFIIKFQSKWQCPPTAVLLGPHEWLNFVFQVKNQMIFTKKAIENNNGEFIFGGVPVKPHSEPGISAQISPDLIKYFAWEVLKEEKKDENKEELSS